MSQLCFIDWNWFWISDLLTRGYFPGGYSVQLQAQSYAWARVCISGPITRCFSARRFKCFMLTVQRKLSLRITRIIPEIFCWAGWAGHWYWSCAKSLYQESGGLFNWSGTGASNVMKPNVYKNEAECSRDHRWIDKLFHVIRWNSRLAGLVQIVMDLTVTGFTLPVQFGFFPIFRDINLRSIRSI
jgi:hypothetical protein